QLLANVAMDGVGIIFSRELSRLSRTDKDWCHLMEVCQVFNTLIAIQHSAKAFFNLWGIDSSALDYSDTPYC
ncbi:MAG: hypothetical protein GY792_19025, partial [Gammaproteobacteria bacterium]|nr:hypothetical protein [Gammaproteobacteria bacterium]